MYTNFLLPFFLHQALIMPMIFQCFFAWKRKIDHQSIQISYQSDHQNVILFILISRGYWNMYEWLKYKSQYRYMDVSTVPFYWNVHNKLVSFDCPIEVRAHCCVMHRLNTLKLMPLCLSLQHFSWCIQLDSILELISFFHS